MEIEKNGNSHLCIEEKLPLISTMTWSEYMKYKIFKKNSVIDFYTGESLDKIGGELLDEAVNAQALVCALVLTIPFGIIGNFNFQYYNDVQEISIACPQFNYKRVHTGFLNELVFVIYSSVSGLVFSTLYYILRPSDIKLWWKRGRYFYFLLFLFTSSSVISLLCLTSYLISFYSMASDDFCTSFAAYGIVPSIILVVLFLICLMLLI